MWIYTMCVQVPAKVRRGHEGIGPLGAGVADSFEYWELDLGPLQEWYVLLTTEHLSSPDPLTLYLSTLTRWNPKLPEKSHFLISRVKMIKLREFHEAGTADPGKGLRWAEMESVCLPAMSCSKPGIDSGSVFGALLRRLGAIGRYRRFQNRSVHWTEFSLKKNIL